MTTVAVIMSALNEEYIEQTIGTLLARSSAHLSEIIIVDDCSDVPVDISTYKCGGDEPVVLQSARITQDGEEFSSPCMRCIRNNERLGLIRSRNIGARAASSDIIISMDPHIKVDPNWLPPIVERLEANYKCIGIPLTRGLNAERWEESPNKDAKTAWRWDLDFYWANDDKTDLSPAMAGHCFAFTKRWFDESGGLDDGMEKWGGENIEFSLRTWLCGGSVEIIRESTTAHWFKTGFVNYSMDGRSLLHNKARIAEVWLDEYKDVFYQTLRKKPGSVEVGDLSKMKDIKRRLQVRPFQWYVDNLDPSLGGVMKLRNKWPNGNIAVLGAGPSLDHTSAEMLKCYDVVIGVNWTALAFDCDFVVFHDIKPAKDVLDSGKYRPEQLLVPEKLKDGTGRFADLASNISNDWTVYRLGAQDNDGSLKNKWPPFFHHATTVHTAVHFATFLGANRVMLFGCDTKFAPDGRSHTKLVKQYRRGRYWPQNKDSEKYLARIQRGYDMLRKRLREWNVSFLRTDYL